MSENDTAQTKTESTPEPAATEITQSEKKKSHTGTIAAIVIVAIILLGVLYKLEKEGRSSTHLFTSMIEKQMQNKVVATVNGDDITNQQLDLGVTQFSQVATAQGVDTTSPEVQADMRAQALEVLINTTLLKQDAVERGIEVSDEQVAERLESVTAELGGDEVLAERMASLGITEEQLHSDIKDELVIQALLEEVFAEADIVVTEEEVTQVYESAGGEEAGLPALEEVEEQVEAQIKASKEQAAIDEYISELKEDAEIEVAEE